jgi:phage shock protein PspC (stress-responsive transcriptional regulator)
MSTEKQRQPASLLLVIVGTILILFGLSIFARTVLGDIWSPFASIIWWGVRLFWPIVLVGMGIFVIYLASAGVFSRHQPTEFTFSAPQPGTRLYRSRSDRHLAGVCGGLANYFGMDPTIVRIIAVALFFFGVFFPVCVAYFIAWLVVPEE